MKSRKNLGNPILARWIISWPCCASIGMKYQLCFKPGASTPAFVYAEGAQPFETRVMNPHRANFGEAIVIPVPWDPDLSAKLFAGDRTTRRTLCERSVVRKRRAYMRELR